MGLSFTGASDIVNFGSAASLDDLNAGSFIIWAYTGTDYTTQRRLFTKGYAGGHGMFNYSDIATSGTIQWAREWSRATTSLLVNATVTNFAAWATGKWVCFASVWNNGGVDGDQKLYMGDLSTALAEPSAYNTQRVGTGAVQSDAAASLMIGNRDNNNVNWNETIAFAAFYNTALTENELKTQQFNIQYPIKATVLFVNLGFNGTGTQADWSGNLNNGTVTNSGQAVHVPVGWYGLKQNPYVVAAAATGHSLVLSDNLSNRIFGGFVVQ